MNKAWDYFRARLWERSTWLALAKAVGSAALLPYPWSLVMVVVNLVASLVPDGGKAAA